VFAAVELPWSVF
jgi:hypothetical protein